LAAPWQFSFRARASAVRSEDAIAVELHFVPPNLSALDALESEVLACSIWEDVRPCDGVAGLCDWRLGGAISSLQRQGFVTGARGDLLLMPGRPRLSFDKILLFGAGARSSFDEARFREVMHHMLATLADLRARVAVVQLPGRQADLIPAERAADLLLEAASRKRPARYDAWIVRTDKDAVRSLFDTIFTTEVEYRNDQSQQS